jgi:antirestriction protein ArdC
MHGTYQPSPRGEPGARGVESGTTSGRSTKRRAAKGRTSKARAKGSGRAAGGEGGVKGGGSGDRADPGYTAAPKVSIYDEVTARIVAELESGRVPWVQPWASDQSCIGGTLVAMPRNARTARAYSGINVLILWFAAIEKGYPLQGWLTFRQALEAGGSVRKGECGTTVVYADRFVPKEAKSGGLRGSASQPTGNKPVPGAERARATAADEPAKAIPFLKRFTVFNVAQVAGLPADMLLPPAPLPERELVPVAESLIAASGVHFRIGGDEAYYSPALDFVQVPPQTAFYEQINFYRTALHELTHATAHASRLNRRITTDFGTKDYAREELVAEMGSAFLCASLGIVPTVRHADYMASWLSVLREDNRAIFRAASAASKAADWLLARHAAQSPDAVA